MSIDFNHPLAIQVRKKMVKAIASFNLIEEGDKIMVCVSGGKDSSVLLALLTEIQRRAPYTFTIEAVMLDQKQPGFDSQAYRSWVESEVKVPLHIVERDTYSIVTSKIQGGVYCSLCSRLRRAILYDYAVENSFSKMALGHHRDDFNQTLLLNLFYTGKISSMPPKLKSDDGRNILVRPLLYVSEDELVELSQLWGFPVIPCNLCGSQDNLKRKKMKKLLKELSQEIPFIQESLIGAQSNIRPSQLLDTQLFNFFDLEKNKIDTESEDINSNSQLF